MLAQRKFFQTHGSPANINESTLGPACTFNMLRRSMEGSPLTSGERLPGLHPTLSLECAKRGGALHAQLPREPLRAREL
jgi:hypothetical protein